eukprot:PhF_6_TR37816/c0_g1_i1/m.56304
MAEKDRIAFLESQLAEKEQTIALLKKKIEEQLPSSKKNYVVDPWYLCSKCSKKLIATQNSDDLLRYEDRVSIPGQLSSVKQRGSFPSMLTSPPRPNFGTSPKGAATSTQYMSSVYYSLRLNRSSV